jgi:hypothetical protein
MAKKQNHIIKSLKAVRGLDRLAHFENGGTLIEWMGGPHLITNDKKKSKNKNACRGNQRYN